ncbi:GNAT family N-acetyltransferase [Streptomyces sp. NPDC005046]
MACACVAPEERGSNLTVSMIAERLRPLRERGAVLATIWTTSTRYARRLGWEAPAAVFTWTVPTDQLRHSFDQTDFEISHATGRDQPLQREFAARWNGPWSRPGWWAEWQQQEHPDLTGYQFNRPGQQPTGVLSLASNTTRRMDGSWSFTTFGPTTRPRPEPCSRSSAATPAGSPLLCSSGPDCRPHRCSCTTCTGLDRRLPSHGTRGCCASWT